MKLIQFVITLLLMATPFVVFVNNINTLISVHKAVFFHLAPKRGSVHT
jgi:hypothetical protein